MHESRNFSCSSAEAEVFLPFFSGAGVLVLSSDMVVLVDR